MLKFFLLFFILICGILVVFLPSFTAMQDKKQQNFEYQQQLKQLKAENKELQEEKRLLEDDPVYLEKVAREKMGLVREGEVIYRITPVNNEE